MKARERAGSIPGRQRIYPSNAARQAAYRARRRKREAAFADAAGGRFSDAVARVQELADQEIASLRSDKEVMREERDAALRLASSARHRIERAEQAAAGARAKRDSAHQEMRALKARYEALIGDLTGELAFLTREISKAGVSHRIGTYVKTRPSHWVNGGRSERPTG